MSPTGHTRTLVFYARQKVEGRLPFPCPGNFSIYWNRKREALHPLSILVILSVNRARGFATGYAECTAIRDARQNVRPRYRLTLVRVAFYGKCDFTRNRKKNTHKQFITDYRVFLTRNENVFRKSFNLFSPFFPLISLFRILLKIPYKRVLHVRHKGRCRFRSRPFVRLKAGLVHGLCRVIALPSDGAKVVEFSHRPCRPRDCADRRVDVVARCGKRRTSFRLFRGIDPRKYHPRIIRVSSGY